MRSILTIEDHAGIRKLIRITLQFEGYQIIEADTGDSGLAAALAQRPDLILIDVMAKRAFACTNGLLMSIRSTNWPGLIWRLPFRD